MLRLKKITLLGFKSFCDPTEFSVQGTGIAVVAGPNGCGKSNILDGMSWVLGEQSAKSLRGGQMQDCIFAGTRDRRSLAMAEVSLILVDPKVSDEPIEIAEDASTNSGYCPDWDEDANRRQRATETEELAAALRAGHLAEGDGVPQSEPVFDSSQTAVLKTRRREPHPTPARGEVIITRRLFRSGESEYLLNGRLCRLRDLQDIFLATGLGPDTYAIISQEQIGQLLSSKPGDRRAVIEEAAGIGALKSQRRVARNQLQRAQDSLARVDDIFDEVGSQVSGLKREAAKAERYTSARQELRERLHVVLASRMIVFDTHIARLEERLATLAGEILDASAKLEANEQRQHELTQENYDQDRRFQEALNKANVAEVELESITAQQSENGERREELQGRLNAIENELVQTRTELSQMREEEELLRAKFASSAEQLQSFRLNVETERQQTRAAAEDVLRTEREIETDRRRVMQLIVHIGDAHNKLVQAEESFVMLTHESERLASEIQLGREHLSNLESERQHFQHQHQAESELLTEINRDISLLTENLRSQQAEEVAARARANKLRAEHSTAIGQLQSLRKLIENHSYATDTVKRLLRAEVYGEGTQAIGVLADFLKVRSEFEPIIEDFLRNELNYVVVENWKAAEAGVRFLRSDLDGRATFLVYSRTTGTSEPNEQHGSSRKPGLASLRDDVEVLNGFGAALDSVLPKLKQAYIVSNTKDAQSLVTDFPDAFFLTLEGDCFHNQTLTGGTTSHKGPFSLKREQQALEVRLATIEKELAQAEGKYNALTVTIDGLSARLEKRREEQQAKETDIVSQSAALRVAESEILRADRRLQEWISQASRNTEARTGKHETIAEKRDQVTYLEAQQQELERSIEDRQAELAALRQKRDDLEQVSMDSTAELACLKEKQHGTEIALQKVTSLCADLEHRLESLSEQQAAIDGAQEQRVREASEFSERIRTITTRKAESLIQVEAARIETQAIRQRLSELEHELRIQRTMLDGLRENRSAISRDLAKVRTDLEHCEASIVSELGVEPRLLRIDEAVTPISGETLAATEEECRTLRQRVSQVGSVNMLAVEEYKEAVARQELLDGQRKDLLESIASTEMAIKEIDAVAQTQFEAALTQINDNFKSVFEWLFYGGDAHLRVTDSENPEEGGLEIIASPPGKKFQNVRLLSGGERALTALALLVAIFQFRPSPFCVLDEVDAPLDEANIGRFTELMRSLSKNTQFLVVTHSKRMMQAADMIFGITMQEPGVSKVLSLQLKNQ